MMQPRLRGDRGGAPVQEPSRYVPLDGEIIYVEQHVLFIEHSFVKSMNNWYNKAVDVARPWDPSNTRVPATAWDLRPIVKRCYYAPPDTIGLRIDRQRMGFRHEDFPSQIFIAVLEGITSTQPVGRLSFISMVDERKPVADKRVEMEPIPVPDWPPLDCPKSEALIRLERAIVSLSDWLKRCPGNHPKLEEACALRRTVVFEKDRLLKLPDEVFYALNDEDEIFDNE